MQISSAKCEKWSTMREDFGGKDLLGQKKGKKRLIINLSARAGIKYYTFLK